MASKITDFKEEEGVLTFTIYNTDVSYVNALRRTILSDIPIVVFKTIPYEENKANIMVNTSRLNNEIVKQRLGCIPICGSELQESQLKNYLLEVDVENKTDTNLIVTTKDFKIKNLVTDKYLDDNTVKKIFPPYIPPTGNGEYYIDFLRLRPNITKELPGERINLTCEFSMSDARYDSMFNVVGTCAYGCTPDREKMAEQLAIRKQKWKDEGKNEAEIKFEAANWNLLEGLRYVKAKSFDFIIQSLGIYENTDIIIKSCNIVINNLESIKRSLDQDEMEIKPSINTMDNSYDVILVNNDYTIGNILNYELYSVFYQELKALDYVGFKKMHPHDNDSIIRVSVSDKTKGVSAVKTMLTASIEEAIKKLESIKGCFNGSRK
jgi:DNA-directed RNA polymerase subunit L